MIIVAFYLHFFLPQILPPEAGAKGPLPTSLHKTAIRLTFQTARHHWKFLA